MSGKPQKPKPRAPRGFADRPAAEIRGVKRMLARIEEVYERYGFEPGETPLVEYTDALGKFLPDLDRPNEGVFSFQDDDEQWLSLRYDLTAPLARYVAENFDALPKPYRSYRSGWVFRNEKPGPGRFRQFMQFDADTVGAASVAADAENCMMAADAMEAVGLKRGEYVVKVSNRMLLDGVMEAIDLGGNEHANQRLNVLRAIDKYDRLGVQGVRNLLGPGRQDASGDFTQGANLKKHQVDTLIRFVDFSSIYNAIQRGEYEERDTNYPNPFTHPPINWKDQGYSQSICDMAKKVMELNPANRAYDWTFSLDVLGEISYLFDLNAVLSKGLRDLVDMDEVFHKNGYYEGERPQIMIDPSVVRGLEYYTGPVYEVELLFEVPNEQGVPVRFGSVGGGGRYDGLVGRFRPEPVPATGFSIGVSRLASALKNLGRLEGAGTPGPVVVLVMDRAERPHYQTLVARLRAAGIAAESYLGESGMKAQMRYADRRNSPCVVIQGGDERARGTVQIKDLAEGARAAAGIASNQEWREQRPAQFECPEGELVQRVREVLARGEG